jgi:hypothetical protein
MVDLDKSVLKKMICVMGTRLAAFTIRAWSRRTFHVGGCANGIFR